MRVFRVGSGGGGEGGFYSSVGHCGGCFMRKLLEQHYNGWLRPFTSFDTLVLCK